VHQRFCEEGLKLDTVYYERTRTWVGAEAEKRVAMGVGRAVSTKDWNEIARRATDAKLGHEEALRQYMEHVIACSVCNAHVLASSRESLAQHPR
jgi:hypothetical protein